MLQRYGLKDTVVGIDASGLDPTTQSTAADLVKLGELALKNPIIAQIVAMPSGEINFAGPIPNYNAMVTKHGYNGIKPGESVEAGNTLLFSTKKTIQGKDYTIIGAVLGTAGYRESDDAAMQIVDSLQKQATQPQ
jgi:D-alanyl-D-alanine carboxypeptidase (penicillin-binding protein 5/6)